jgi:hypothetical protein
MLKPAKPRIPAPSISRLEGSGTLLHLPGSSRLYAKIVPDEPCVDPSRPSVAKGEGRPNCVSMLMAEEQGAAQPPTNQENIEAVSEIKGHSAVRYHERLKRVRGSRRTYSPVSIGERGVSREGILERECCRDGVRSGVSRTDGCIRVAGVCIDRVSFRRCRKAQRQ